MKGREVLEAKVKKQAAVLGGRIGFTFLFASGFLIFVAFLLLSRNYQNLLGSYTLKLMQTMVAQGVTMVEYEIQVSQEEAEVLANSFPVPDSQEKPAVFPSAYSHPDILRTIYVSEAGTFASDGRQTDLRGREDIRRAFEGKAGIYGPYMNEENEYVICYTAPVIREDEIIGVLSIEKDGYSLCSLIKNIRFGNSGESYIINAEGTDIAVSNPEHIEWVKEQYNAHELLESEMDSETLSVRELEQKGLNGETGVGACYWEDSLCYLAYAPIPSVKWVLLAGLCQKELDEITKSALYSSVTEELVLGGIIIILVLIILLIIFWIFSGMKKTAELNEKLNKMANYDALTGIGNRNSYQARLDALSKGETASLACIYMDVNGLHEVNNHLGHQAGDQMLVTVADVLGHIFSGDNVYRIGGDEFVAFCQNLKQQEVYDRVEKARQELKCQGYEISCGIEWKDHNCNAQAMMNLAEEAMQRDKRCYYKENGRERQIRVLNQAVEQMISDKQDADAFLSVIAPEFKGVYFVDLGLDTIRHLFIPAYFEEMLKESGDVFSKALSLYTQKIVVPKYRRQFEEFCDYSNLETQLSNHITPEYTYQKLDGTWMKLRILKFKTYTLESRETLWIFTKQEI